MRHVLETNVGRIAAAAVLLTGSALAYATPAAAVPADTVKGCYVNGSGTMYRTSAPNAPSVCAKATHVPMSWPDGKGDDYPRYLPANGVRHSSRGFAVTGALSEGTIPISGPGVRMMWYSGKAAFRAGRVQNSQWENSNIGQYSMAMGLNTTASGLASIAFGNGTTASGGSSVALGTNAYAG